MSVHPESGQSAGVATGSPLRGLHDRTSCLICRGAESSSARALAKTLKMPREIVRKHILHFCPPKPKPVAASPVAKRKTGMEKYWEAREAGLSQVTAARAAGVSPTYAAYLESQRRAVMGTAREYDQSVGLSFDRDDELVKRLIAAGGYSRLSEKMTRSGPAACLPLIPFGRVA